MDLKIDTVIVIDAWWNMPDIIAERILNIKCDEIFCNNTFKKSICETLRHLEIKNDLAVFIRGCVDFKRQHNRSKNVLLVGQAWDGGIHYDTLGVDKLIGFLGVLNLFVHPDLMAIKCSHLDRTCTDYHIENFKYRWIKKQNNFYQCQRHKTAW